MDPELESTYRVVGLRNDGTRIQIDDGLSVERANDIHRRLSGACVYDQVVIEHEPPGTRKPPPFVASSNEDSVFDLDDTKR